MDWGFVRGIAILFSPFLLIFIWFYARSLKREGKKVPKILRIFVGKYNPETYKEIESREYDFPNNKMPLIFKLRGLVAFVGIMICMLVMILMKVSEKYYIFISGAIGLAIEESIRLRYKK